MTSSTKQIGTIVVGSGPGGATVARELARAGERVLLLERGRDWRGHPLYGTAPGAMLYTDKHSLLFTREGLNIIRPLMLGGATSMYCGSASRPLPWWREDYGIDLDHHAAETAAELHITPLPPALRGAASTRVAEAAGELGMEWQPQDKFMAPVPSALADCGAHCMLGCRCGAKWNAAAYVDDAVAAGAELWTEALVEQVVFSGRQVAGVRGQRKGEPFMVEAERVVVAAGGIGSAVLLRRSGLFGAGNGMVMDTTAMVYGHAPFKGIGDEPPMSWSYADDDLGVLYATLIDPWLMYPVIMALKGPAYPLSWYRWGRTLGVMIKLEDEVSGSVDIRGRVSKGMTERDRARLARAEQVARRILVRAGCDPHSLILTPLRGTHPSGTVRIGEMLTTDLETEIENLYVCDASVFPRALARPTVLTIISLARRLAAHLSGDQ
ncbi:MAG: GMC family oxidoreductase N-terminal domain-containing protein [Candidatus Promineifilaceae bacterium]|nr:GMC family oxidoreductase N-terminal domain-containing protein [Candidatus Promineifilaceae bacterium]